MAQSFSCPNCNAPIDYNGGELTVRCQFCGSSVIVPESLRGGASASAAGEELLEQSKLLREMAAHLRQGDKIAAIKVYRQAFDSDLADAKAAIDKLAAGQPVVMAGDANASADVERNIDRLVRAGKTIEAIKVYRQAYPAKGLAEAKAAVEKFAATGNLDIPDPSATPEEARAAHHRDSAGDTPDWQAAVAAEVRAGNKLEAIKVYRAATGADLRTAKEVVEDMAAGQPLRMPRTAPRPEMPHTYAPVKTPSRPRIGGLGWTLLVAFCIGFALVCTVGGAYVFPNTLRLAAPLLCPRGYDDAWGSRLGGLALTCYTDPGRTETANLYLALAVMLGFYLLLGAWLTMALAILRTAGWTGLGILLPLSTLLLPLMFFAFGVPAPEGVDVFWVLFSQHAGTRITAPAGQVWLSRVTGAYLSEIWQVGGKGAAPGQFQQTVSVAVDGGGHIYAADRDPSRVQVFDPDGSLKNVWLIDGKYVDSLAGGPDGILFVAQDGGLDRYDGATGKLLGQLAPTEQNIQTIAAQADGSVVAATDEGLIWFNSDGQVARKSDTFKEMLNLDLSPSNLAIDKQGNVYVVGSSAYEVFIFTPQGKLLKRFGSEGDADDQFRFEPSVVAVDAKGRIVVDGRENLSYFDATGRLIGDTGEGTGPEDLAFTPDGRLLMLSSSYNRLIEYQVNR